MIRIAIRTAGDAWLNQDEVEQQLASVDNGIQIIFDTYAEGISLEGSGILAAIDQWVQKTGRDIESVTVKNPNTYEITQYTNIHSKERISANHFFPMSGHYATNVPDPDNDAVLFGFFVGRYTPARNCMVNTILDMYADNFLMSVMRLKFLVPPWDERVYNIGSIDGKTVQDQYACGEDTNLSLLRYYNKFQIELVAETMTNGVTFFPTEKTIRPLLAERPMLVYGPQHFLKNLRVLGFQTYSELWDESYDDYSDSERWHRMQEVISTIIAGDYNRCRAREIAKFNSQHLKKWHEYTNPKGRPGYEP